MIVLNLAFSFAVPGIAIGGHIGGLIGGIAATYLFTQFRRSFQLATLSVVGVGALSVVIAYWQVRGYR
jgi:membrane associated rhomboid family serine protease